MFRRNNKDSNNNEQPADEKVREENRAEQDIRQKVGNQAAGGLPPQIPPNIGNEALNDLISGGGNPVQNVIRKGLDISDEINPNEIRLIQDSLKQNDSGSGDKEDLNNINNLNNIDNNNSAFNIINNNDFPQSNGGIFNVLDQIIEEKNKLLQGEEEDKKEIDQPKQVNIINENNMHDDAGFDDEMDLGDYLDPARIRELRKSPDYHLRLRKPVKPVDLNISNSNIEDALNEDGEDEKETDQKNGKYVPDPGMIGKESGKKQPEKKAPQEDGGWGETYALEEDMVPAPRSKKIGKSRRNKKQSKKAPALSKDAVGNMKGIEEEYWKSGVRERTLKNLAKEFAGGNDRNALNEEMEKIKNWNFQAQKMDDIKAPSKFRRYLSYFARGVGNLLGLALQVITLGHFWRAKSKVRSWFKDEDSWQQEKDHQAIPGWGGAKFDPNATSGKEILADFRRVPTVWSHLTAAKAAETVEKDGEKVEKPLDPVVSVLVDQPVSKTTQTMEGREMGHVMIGIEYSRKSIVSNRYERYKLQYGFYPVKDMLSKLSTISTGLKDSAVVPGMLVDDFGHNYDVSRRYPAKTAQVNAIIQASEKYAEGGYSVFDRNCATFVKEMVVNTAHLATGGDIFRKSEVTFSHLANLGITGSAAFDQNIKAGTETALMDLTGEDAETYENYGNRKVTKRDWTIEIPFINCVNMV